jgi:hypothetical protein
MKIQARSGIDPTIPPKRRSSLDTLSRDRDSGEKAAILCKEPCMILQTWNYQEKYAPSGKTACFAVAWR